MIKLEDVVWEPASGKNLEFVVCPGVLQEKRPEWAMYNGESRKNIEKTKNAISLFLAFAHYLKNKDIWPTT